MVRARGMALGMAGLAGLWTAASVAADRTSGAILVLHRGASIPEAALDGVRQGSLRLAVPNGWRAHLVPALLPMPVPIYIAPQRMVTSAESLPPEIARAANVLVFAQRPVGAEVYRRCPAVTMARSAPVSSCGRGLLSRAGLDLSGGPHAGGM
jgi:hypothetical protein